MALDEVLVRPGRSPCDCRPVAKLAAEPPEALRRARLGQRPALSAILRDDTEALEVGVQTIQASIRCGVLRASPGLARAPHLLVGPCGAPWWAGPPALGALSTGAETASPDWGWVLDLDLLRAVKVQLKAVDACRRGAIAFGNGGRPFPHAR